MPSSSSFKKFWQLIAIVLTTSLLLFTSPQVVAAGGKFTPDQIDKLSTVLTYNELAALPMAKRQEYIVGLRSLVYELELKFSNGSVAGDLRKKMSAQIQFLNLFIGEAEAQSATGFTPTDIQRWTTPIPAKLRRSKLLMESEANYQLTVNGYRPSQAYYRANESDPGLGCPAQVFSNTQIKGFRQTGGRILCVSPSIKYCPMYYRKIAGLQGGPKSGGMICARGFDDIRKRKAQEAAAKAAAAKVAAAKAAVAKSAVGKTRLETQTAGRLQASNEASRNSSKRRPSSNGSAAADSSNSSTDDGGSGAASGAPDAEQSANFDAIDLSQAGKSETTIHTADDKAEQVVVLTEAQMASGDIKAELDKMQDEAGANQVCGEPAETVSPETCNANTIKEAREKFYSEAKGGKDALFPHCLYAGHITHFRDSMKKPGNCRPENEFCLNGLNCRDAANNEIHGASSKYEIGGLTKSMKCKNPNEVICNPLLFDLDANDDPFCVPRTSNATKACFQASDQVKHDKPLIFRLPNLNGIIDGWNAFKDAMDDMCIKNKTTKAFFCIECHMMKVRLFNLRMATLKYNDKTETTDDCFKMAKFLFTPDGGVTVQATGKNTRKKTAAPTDAAN